MIEIIKHGTQPKHLVIATKCFNCGCVFKFDVDDDTYHDRLYCGDFVNCPECGQDILVHNTSSMDHADPDKIVCDVVDVKEYAPEA